ncbi:MAG: BolA/IbaG family iron-sulfur metabolism protein [Gammaproteobacteria bacterium]|nr:BolA/IbaG family iron-sulfur metabolism protein [Gammaproteobacteria bacterium]
MDLQSEIEDRLSKEFGDSNIEVGVQGNHASVKVESERFDGLRPVERQRMVYSCLNELIRNGSLHAVTIVASVPKTL